MSNEINNDSDDIETCPNCGHEISVDTVRGNRVTCPKCGTVVVDSGLEREGEQFDSIHEYQQKSRGSQQGFVSKDSFDTSKDYQKFVEGLTIINRLQLDHPELESMHDTIVKYWESVIKNKVRSNRLHEGIISAIFLASRYHTVTLSLSQVVDWFDDTSFNDVTGFYVNLIDDLKKNPPIPSIQSWVKKTLNTLATKQSISRSVKNRLFAICREITGKIPKLELVGLSKHIVAGTIVFHACSILGLDVTQHDVADVIGSTPTSIMSSTKVLEKYVDIDCLVEKYT